MSRPSDSWISIFIGFITFVFDLFLENMGSIDVFLGMLLKFTSLTSFCIYVFLNYPKIKQRINDITKNR